VKFDMPGQRTLNELLEEDDPNIVARCRVCHRPLRDVVSIDCGMGRTCYRKQLTERGKESHEHREDPGADRGV
jgi:hypothetical protein